MGGGGETGKGCERGEEGREEGMRGEVTRGEERRRR